MDLVNSAIATVVGTAMLSYVVMMVTAGLARLLKIWLGWVD